jgi:enoyl-CoA hydratase/carnithine racemase
MNCEAIEYELGADHVATITLNRPDALNSWNDQMAEEMSWLGKPSWEDDDAHAVVLRANGERAFSTGADVRGGTTWFFKANVWNTFDPGTTLSPKSHHRCWKPVMAAVHGIAAGGAQYFLNEADIIIARTRWPTSTSAIGGRRADQLRLPVPIPQRTAEDRLLRQ